jgi:hypothetical protein
MTYHSLSNLYVHIHNRRTAEDLGMPKATSELALQGEHYSEKQGSTQGIMTEIPHSFWEHGGGRRWNLARDSVWIVERERKCWEGGGQN